MPVSDDGALTPDGYQSKEWNQDRAHWNGYLCSFPDCTLCYPPEPEDEPNPEKEHK